MNIILNIIPLFLSLLSFILYLSQIFYSCILVLNLQGSVINCCILANVFVRCNGVVWPPKMTCGLKIYAMVTSSILICIEIGLHSVTAHINAHNSSLHEREPVQIKYLSAETNSGTYSLFYDNLDDL